MSFRINTNVDAMNTLFNLGQTSSKLSQSITRLSTGLRINSAADDPAGLIISEKFKSEIGGIDQAVQNSQDAINYSKTAEGAFNEVNSLLNDARSLAVASANSATLTTSQLQANQSSLNSIVSSITRIAQTTQYGAKNLLDGSSGVTASVTDGADVASLGIGGTFGGNSLTANATVTLNSVTAATQGSVNSAAFAALTTAVNTAGSFTINGVTFNANASTTVSDVLNMVNQASGQTGVNASYDGAKIVFTANQYGSVGKVNLTDANGVLLAAAGSATGTGTDAHASVTIGSTTNVLFTGGVGGTDGLTLTDADGNTMKLTVAGNSFGNTAAAIGQAQVGSAQFQIGGNAGQTASLAIGNFAATNLGNGAVSGLSMANLDLTTAAGANDAIKVIDAAIDQVSKARGDIGSFQKNVLESNIRSLGVAKENLSAAVSDIQDTDVAAEMTNYTKLQILQQSGMAMLTQANNAPQSVLALLRG
jgi:flagellin